MNEGEIYFSYYNIYFEGNLELNDEDDKKGRRI